MAVGGMLVAPQLIRTLAGPQWIGCATLVRILFFMGAFQSFIQLAWAIWMALGRSKLVMFWGLTSNLAVLAAFLGGALIGHSAEAVATAYMLYTVCLLAPWCLYCTRRWCGIPLKGLGKGLLRIMPDVAVMGSAVWAVGAVMIHGGVPAPITLLAQIAVGAVTYLGCFRLGSAAELESILSALPAKIQGIARRLLRLMPPENAAPRPFQNSRRAA
jgi:O-antigen/teichoic acid export membrane protein